MGSTIGKPVNQNAASRAIADAMRSRANIRTRNQIIASHGKDLLTDNWQLQKNIGALFKMSYYDFVISRLTVNKTMWTEHNSLHGILKGTLSRLEGRDRLKFLRNIGYPALLNVFICPRSGSSEKHISDFYLDTILAMLNMNDRRSFIDGLLTACTEHVFAGKDEVSKELLRIAHRAENNGTLDRETDWRRTGTDQKEKVTPLRRFNTFLPEKNLPCSRMPEDIARYGLKK